MKICTYKSLNSDTIESMARIIDKDETWPTLNLDHGFSSHIFASDHGSPKNLDFLKFKISCVFCNTRYFIVFLGKIKMRGCIIWFPSEKKKRGQLVIFWKFPFLPLDLDFDFGAINVKKKCHNLFFYVSIYLVDLNSRERLYSLSFCHGSFSIMSLLQTI